jgi:uncharacterized protein GlcG (DUF336 family)
MMVKTALKGVLAAACLLPTVGFAAPVPPSSGFVRSIPLDLALEAANAALADCRRQGAHPTVGVMDFAGQVKLMLVDDNASLISQKAVLKTMYLALMLPTSTMSTYTRDEVADAREIGPSAGVFERIAPGKPLNQPGAIPIRVGNVVVGAIGVNGALTYEMNDACAKAGIAKIQDRLK